MLKVSIKTQKLEDRIHFKPCKKLSILLKNNKEFAKYQEIKNLTIWKMESQFVLFVVYRSGTVNSNTVNSKFHFIRSFFEIFATFLLFHV